jgi:uncharacterized protein YhdP
MCAFASAATCASFRSPIRAAAVQRGGADRARVLQYADGWPRIENIQGELLFERERMHIAGTSGSISAWRSPTSRWPFQLRDPSPLLEVNGERAGATADFLRFIESSRCAA